MKLLTDNGGEYIARPVSEGERCPHGALANEPCEQCSIPPSKDAELIGLLQAVPLLIPDNLSDAARDDGALRIYFDQLAAWLPQARAVLEGARSVMLRPEGGSMHALVGQFVTARLRDEVGCRQGWVISVDPLRIRGESGTEYDCEGEPTIVINPPEPAGWTCPRCGIEFPDCLQPCPACGKWIPPNAPAEAAATADRLGPVVGNGGRK
jgi:hypothetical protein